MQIESVAKHSPAESERAVPSEDTFARALIAAIMALITRLTCCEAAKSVARNQPLRADIDDRSLLAFAKRADG